MVLSPPICQLACLSVLQGEHIVVMHGAHVPDQVGIALVDRIRYLKPASVDSYSQHSSIYVFLCLCACLSVCKGRHLLKSRVSTSLC